ncbi:chromate efflux transporter [Puniceibacterium sediminis]|uniref:Chromate transporter n=1 Tax=Puniceibacterium sediminis TaxID=1608407 RepID=A0A238YJY5_9RHOB|nr:chromate efflux transporter [Puniceibacterium sediminis]SNR71360.1 chromate transporter [Puniceibacterium sediminis]
MPPPPSWPEMLHVFGRIGLLSFGGPAAQIGVMHRELVDERPWLSEQQFLNALGFCMLLPGPEAMQLATYAGWRLRGTAGGLLAGLLFVLPGALVIAVLTLLYARYGTLPQTESLLLGIKATVIVIVYEALRRLMRKGLTGPAMSWVAGLSFAAIFLFQIPFPLLILAAAAFGATRASPAPVQQTLPTGTFRPGVILLWATLWLLPLPLLALSGQTLLFDLSAFFAKLAVVTFGGAYAVLAYMAQEVVTARGWLDPLQMVDALGLAETTPGPLILVTQFVGMLTGYTAGGTGLALAAGALTLWMTFVPCFLWIFAGAPYVEHLQTRPRLQSALGAITAAVVGVILNLSVWFALHVVFNTVTQVNFGPLSLPIPDPASLRSDALILTALAALLLLVLHRGPLITLPLMALAGWALSLL